MEGARGALAVATDVDAGIGTQQSSGVDRASIGNHRVTRSHLGTGARAFSSPLWRVPSGGRRHGRARGSGRY